MRWATCQLNQCYVGGTTAGGALAKGSRVDLDAEVSPGVTYADALGKHLAHFTLDEAPARASRSTRPPADSRGDSSKDE